MSFATDAVRSTRYRSTDCESSGYKCQILPQGKKGQFFISIIDNSPDINGPYKISVGHRFKQFEKTADPKQDAVVFLFIKFTIIFFNPDRLRF